MNAPAGGAHRVGGSRLSGLCGTLSSQCIAVRARTASSPMRTTGMTDAAPLTPHRRTARKRRSVWPAGSTFFSHDKDNRSTLGRPRHEGRGNRGDGRMLATRNRRRSPLWRHGSAGRWNRLHPTFAGLGENGGRRACRPGLRQGNATSRLSVEHLNMQHLETRQFRKHYAANRKRNRDRACKKFQ